MCDDQVSAASTLPTCFTGVAQSPIDINANSGIVQDEDPGQISFIGYNDQLGETPMLRLKDFTVQLDFEETPAIAALTPRHQGSGISEVPTSTSAVGSSVVTSATHPREASAIQPTVRRRDQKKKAKNKKKRRRKQKGKRKRQSRRRVRREANVPSITGGALGQDT